MQTFTITITVPDGVSFNIGQTATRVPEQFTPAQSAGITQPIAAQSPQEATKPAGPTLEDLTKAFLAAVSRAKAAGDDKASAAFKALGTAKVKEVPLVAYADVIAALNDVAK